MHMNIVKDITGDLSHRKEGEASVISITVKMRQPKMVKEFYGGMTTMARKEGKVKEEGIHQREC